ncbi:hypothetical protein [Parvibaculum sp.]|uniref:hypothetical protein n=1 Tax=Parvibaculum sp. TaxID=2024848 RepID=UPI0034A03F06
MVQIIYYQRPETRAAVSRIMVPTDDETVKQIRRLRALGYTIVSVSAEADVQSPMPRIPRLGTAR